MSSGGRSGRAASALAGMSAEDARSIAGGAASISSCPRLRARPRRRAPRRRQAGSAAASRDRGASVVHAMRSRPGGAPTSAEERPRRRGRPPRVAGRRARDRRRGRRRRRRRCGRAARWSRSSSAGRAPTSRGRATASGRRGRTRPAGMRIEPPPSEPWRDRAQPARRARRAAPPDEPPGRARPCPTGCARSGTRATPSSSGTRTRVCSSCRGSRSRPRRMRATTRRHGRAPGRSTSPSRASCGCPRCRGGP